MLRKLRISFPSLLRLKPCWEIVHDRLTVDFYSGFEGASCYRQDFAFFRNLQHISLRNFFDDPNRSRQQTVQLLRHSPNLHRLELGLSAEAVVRQLEREGSFGVFVHFFDRLCDEYAESGGQPLRLTYLGLFDAMWVWKPESWRKKPADLAFLQEVRLNTETIEDYITDNLVDLFDSEALSGYAVLVETDRASKYGPAYLVGARELEMRWPRTLMQLEEMSLVLGGTWGNQKLLAVTTRHSLQGLVVNMNGPDPRRSLDFLLAPLQNMHRLARLWIVSANMYKDLPLLTKAAQKGGCRVSCLALHRDRVALLGGNWQN